MDKFVYLGFVLISFVGFSIDLILEFFLNWTLAKVLSVVVMIVFLSAFFFWIRKREDKKDIELAQRLHKTSFDIEL